MIDRAQKMRGAVDSFVYAHQQAPRAKRTGVLEEISLRNDTLMPEDWHVLSEMKEVL